MAPYDQPHLNQIYQQLFCDDIDAYGVDGQQAGDPWKGLLDPDIATGTLRSIKSDETLETRPRLLANNLLRLRSDMDDSRHLYGVIVEMHMEEGLDVLAVYEDGSARYINYSGSAVIWDAVTDESERLKKDLFAASEAVVKQIGAWDAERLPPPVRGNARLSFLVADGIYFGEAPFDALSGDPMGGNVLNQAAAFMTYLVENAMDQPR